MSSDTAPVRALDAEPNTGRIRWSWIVAGVITFLGCALPIASIGALRSELVTRGEIHRLVDETYIALSSKQVTEPRTRLRHLRLLLDNLPTNRERAGRLRAVGMEIAAYASGPSISRMRKGQRALAELRSYLAEESRILESELIRRAIYIGLVGICGALLLVLIGIRGDPPSSLDPNALRESQPVVQRLARLVEISGRRERRTERLLASMDATLVDIDRHGQVEYISPGGSHLFQLPIGTLLNQSAMEVIVLTTDDGSLVQSFRHASASRKAYHLHAREGSRQLVTVDFFEDSQQGASVLLRLAESREAQRQTLRELEDVYQASYADERLVMVLIDRSGKVCRSSSAADRWLAIRGPGATVFEPWAEQLELARLVEEPPTKEAAERTFDRVLQDPQGNQAKIQFRLVLLEDGGWSVRGWVDVLPVAKNRGLLNTTPPPLDMPTVKMLPSDMPGFVSSASSTATLPNGLAQLSSNHESGRRPQVLVIDDEPAIGRAIVRALKGMDVVVAEGGHEGMNAALATPNRWDLILCDIGMPELDGVGVYNGIKTQEPSLLERTVFMTGALHTERARGFVQKVNPPLLTKPFDVEQVRSVLKSRSISIRAVEGVFTP